MLDQLSTGVAMFDAGQKLTFYNTAYAALWNLDAAYLDQQPTDSGPARHAAHRAASCPRSRTTGNGGELHAAYRALEAKDHTWHLPDGRTLRVVTTPNPDGGVTYLFDDVTERLDLARRFQELIRVQGETLDNLAEGVAVFGSDGRLRLANSAFGRMWQLVAADLERAAAYRNRVRLVPAAAWRRRHLARAARCGDRDGQPRSRYRDGSSGATAWWSIAPPCRCPTAPRS